MSDREEPIGPFSRLARPGLDEKEVRRNKRHVAAAEQFPVFEGKEWKRSQVLGRTPSYSAVIAGCVVC